LTTDERAELQRRVRSLRIRAEGARRVRVILMLADGESDSAIEAAIPRYRDYVNRWRRRFLAERLNGLQPRYRGQPPSVLTPAVDARVLEKTRPGQAAAIDDRVKGGMRPLEPGAVAMDRIKRCYPGARLCASTPPPIWAQSGRHRVQGARLE